MEMKDSKLPKVRITIIFNNYPLPELFNAEKENLLKKCRTQEERNAVTNSKVFENLEAYAEFCWHEDVEGEMFPFFDDRIVYIGDIKPTPTSPRIGPLRELLPQVVKRL